VLQQYKKQRIATLIDGISTGGYDVIVFQECLNTWFSDAHMRSILTKCAALGFVHTSLPPLGPRLPATLCKYHSSFAFVLGPKAAI
jgi:hypothetical protein